MPAGGKPYRQKARKGKKGGGAGNNPKARHKTVNEKSSQYARQGGKGKGSIVGTMKAPAGGAPAAQRLRRGPMRVHV